MRSHLNVTRQLRQDYFAFDDNTIVLDEEEWGENADFNFWEIPGLQVTTPRSKVRSAPSRVKAQFFSVPLRKKEEKSSKPDKANVDDHEKELEAGKKLTNKQSVHERPADVSSKAYKPISTSQPSAETKSATITTSPQEPKTSHGGSATENSNSRNEKLDPESRDGDRFLGHNSVQQLLDSENDDYVAPKITTKPPAAKAVTKETKRPESRFAATTARATTAESDDDVGLEAQKARSGDNLKYDAGEAGDDTASAVTTSQPPTTTASTTVTTTTATASSTAPPAPSPPKASGSDFIAKLFGNADFVDYSGVNYEIMQDARSQGYYR